MKITWHKWSLGDHLLIDFSLTVKTATFIFISGRGSAISSAKQGKSGFENQLMLFMFYLEKRKIVACNMLAKLVDF